MHSAVANTMRLKATQSRLRVQCPECRDQYEPDKSACYCGELNRRKAYDDARRCRGLVPLYHPPSKRY